MSLSRAVHRISPLAAGLIVVALIACSSDDGPPPSDIVSSIPWGNRENLVYRVLSEDGDNLGAIELSVAPASNGNETALTQSFRGTSTTDISTVVVDPRTVKPKSATRTVTDQRGETETIEVAYTDQGAEITQGDKQSGLSVPEHSYDNDSSLFLWRTIDFREGYEASYVTVITNRRNRQNVTLRVLGKETVQVPAGSFSAWKLEIKAGGVTQTAWYADTVNRELLKYDNDNGLIYEMTCCVAR